MGTPLSTDNQTLETTPLGDFEDALSDYVLDPEYTLEELGYQTTNQKLQWNSRVKKQKLNLEITSRFQNIINPDISIIIDTRTFKCHLRLLKHFAEYFKDVKESETELKIPEEICSPFEFNFIYNWMRDYVDLKDFDRSNILDIFIAARNLKIDSLKELCWTLIDSKVFFDEPTAYILYLDAKDKGIREVWELMIPRIKKFFFLLVGSEDWLELKLEEVKDFLQSNYIHVNCELEVFMSAIRWLQHDWKNRKKYALELVECVRFRNMSSCQIVVIKRYMNNPEFQEVLKDPAVRKLIENDLAERIYDNQYGRKYREEAGMRNWTATPKFYLSYRQFLIFLDQYRKNYLPKTQ